MPRREIDIPHTISYISVLDENGDADKGLEPDVPRELLMKLYKAMLLGRRFDERMLTMQRQGRIGTFAPIRGQEASQLGAIAVLEPEDWLVPSFRESAGEIWRGRSMESILLVYSGFNEGGSIPEDCNNLPVSVPVGTQPLHATGLGYAIKYRKKKQVAMVFFGDGATSEGDFHEAMNFAAVFQTPTVFVCQNNQWAISIPRSRQTRSRTLAQKAVAYDMPGVQVDGNDILAVYAASKEAVDRARSGGGPTMIECITYRLGVHTTADDPKKYRKEEEVEEWLKRDPILRFQKYLKSKGLLSEENISSIEDEVKAKIREAENRWAEFMEKPVDPLEMFNYMYTDMPLNLVTQKEELKRELEEKRRQVEKESVIRD